MADNVVSLRGDAKPAPDATILLNSTLIGELERLLEAARSGEILGMAGSYMHRDKVVTYSYAGSIAGYGLIGGLECVKQRLVGAAVAHD